MFDRAIIDTDRFMDLPMSAKALYFLLGMEADDEGFVSYKKVTRIHGGTEDDTRVLVAKGFLISFLSGVVVITDWNKNNWLDTRRLRPTEYKKEKALLTLTQAKEYVLSNGLASIEERSIVNTVKKTETNVSPSFSSVGKEITTAPVDDWGLTKKAQIDEPFDTVSFIAKLAKSKQHFENVIALYWSKKGFNFTNLKQAQSQYKRDMKPASELKGYTGKQISKVMGIIDAEAVELGYDWKLSTVGKKIADLTKND